MRGEEMEFLCLELCRPASAKVCRVALLAFFFFAWAATIPCCAQQSNSGSQAAPAATGQNVLDVGDVYLPGSRVYVFVGKSGLGHEHGVVGQLKQGRVNLAAARDAGGLVIDMASFSADTPEARKFVGLEGATDASTQQQVNANMRGPDVLDVAHFPTATFAIKQVTKLDKLSRRNLPQYQLNGDFTLHGVARPIQVVAEAEDQNGWTHLMGGFTMLQSQFGMTPFTKAFGAIGVSDQLSVWGDLWISKQRQVASRPTVTR
jgi:polyisoprenoid-binding protein YceI